MLQGPKLLLEILMKWRIGLISQFAQIPDMMEKHYISNVQFRTNYISSREPGKAGCCLAPYSWDAGYLGCKMPCVLSWWSVAVATFQEILSRIKFFLATAFKRKMRHVLYTGDKRTWTPQGAFTFLKIYLMPLFFLLFSYLLPFTLWSGPTVQ